MSLNISFILPALNEEGNLAQTVEVLENVSLLLSLMYEIIIVDDGSTDNTYQEAISIVQNNNNVRVIKHEKNKGIGAAYKSGLGLTIKDYVMLIPADNAWSEYDIIRILNMVGKADIVIPYILGAGDKSRMRVVVSKSYTYLINKLFKLKLPYYNGIVVHNVKIIKGINIDSNDFTYQTEALVKLIKNGNFSYVCIEANTIQRNNGKSKAINLLNIIRAMKSILQLYFKKIK
jgi:glycosyltransferase involved in cell wall biosynthesis